MQVRRMPTEMRDLIDLHLQLGDFDGPYLGIRSLGQFLYSFGNVGFQVRDAYFVGITANIWQVVFRQSLSRAKELLVQLRSTLLQIGFCFQGSRRSMDGLSVYF